jgi:hypothetical protein
MLNVDTTNYTAKIPVYDDTNKVSYYIEAQDVSGRVARHSIMGANDPHVFWTIGQAASNRKIVRQKLVKIYPNPCSGNFYLWINDFAMQDIKIEIINISGETVFSENYFVKNRGELLNINAKGIEAGIYVLRIKNSQRIIVDKLIVK